MRWPFHRWTFHKWIHVFVPNPEILTGAYKYSDQCAKCGLLRHRYDPVSAVQGSALTYEPTGSGTPSDSIWHYPDGERRCGKPKERE